MTKSDQFANLFNGNIVLTSSEIVKRLTATGKTDHNARQIISRAAGDKTLWRTIDLKLSQGGRLFSLPEHIGTPRFSQELAAKLKENRPGIARLLEAFADRPVIHKVEAMKLLAVGDSSKVEKRTYDREVLALREIGIETVQAGTVLESLVQKGFSLEADELAAWTTEELRKQVVVTRIILERLRRQAIASWNLGEYPDHQQSYVVFNKQIFSGFSFSYLAPVTRFSESKKPIGCPILIDVQWDTIRENHLDSLLQRIKRATHRGKSKQSVLAVIAGLDFTREAFIEARRNGLIVMSLRQEFGEEALTSMIAVEELIQAVSIGGATDEVMASRFNTFADTIEELKTNPVVVDLRSLAMEATTGFIVRSLGYETVELGLNVPWKNTQRDVDVFGFQGDELRIIECKAHHGGHSLAEVDVSKFFTETVPALKAYLRDSGRSFETCVAEIWTTGPRGQVAADLFNRLSIPKSDRWNIVTQRALCDLVPSRIASRVVPLLQTLGCVKTDGTWPSQLNPESSAPKLKVPAAKSAGLLESNHSLADSDADMPF